MWPWKGSGRRQLWAKGPGTAKGGQTKARSVDLALAVGTRNKLSEGSTALPKVGWIASLEAWPKCLTGPPAAATNGGFKLAPEGLATGMGVPDKALVTEAVIPTGKLGQQPRAGTADPGAATKG